MLNKILSLGDKIDIKRLDSNGRIVKSMKTFVSQLVDFVDFDVINIATPIVYGKTILLDVGDKFNLCFYSSIGLYQCNCIILSNHKENNTMVSVVRITSNLEKFQRRQYYRLECIHDITYRIITIEEEILMKKLKEEDFQSVEERNEYRRRLSQYDKAWIQAAIIDLSGGGARFNSNELHNQGEKILMKLDFNISGELKKMQLSAVIITSNKIMNRIGAYEHRVEFQNILQKDREDLIKYIFEQERKRRRNDKS
jgi:c-di-GMP-binding flagellar brake protein YcgR